MQEALCILEIHMQYLIFKLEFCIWRVKPLLANPVTYNYAHTY